MTISAMFVAWSATRSRKREIRMRRIARGIVFGSSIMNVRSSRKICSFKASTSGSSPQTFRASSVSRLTNESRLSFTMLCAFSAIRGRSTYGLSCGSRFSSSARWAMFTAWSPIRSRSVTIFSWRIAPRAGARPSAAGSLAAAGAEVGVVALGARPRVVGVGEDGDPGGLRRTGLAEELLVVGERVHLLLDPVVLVRLAAPEHEHLREAIVGVEVGADRHPLAPDVLHRLRPRDARVRDQQIDGERAVVRP